MGTVRRFIRMFPVYQVEEVLFLSVDEVYTWLLYDNIEQDVNDKTRKYYEDKAKKP